MINGFDLLVARKYDAKFPDYFEIEKKYLIKIPKIYKMFIQTFSWKENAMNSENVFYYIPDGTIGELQFWTLSIEELIKNTFAAGNYYKDKGVIFLAASNVYSDGIMIGTKGEFEDKIIVSDESEISGLRVVSENIFQFLRGVTDNIFEFVQSEQELKKFLEELGWDDDEVQDELTAWRSN